MDNQNNLKTWGEPNVVQTSAANIQRLQSFKMDPQDLQAELDMVKSEIHHLIMDSDEPQQMLLQLKGDLKRREGHWKLSQRGFTTEQQWNNENINLVGTDISNKGNLQVQTEQQETIQNLTHQEKEKMAASLEAERQKVSQQSDEDVPLKGDNMMTALRDEWQMKVNQLNLQLHEKDKEVMKLGEENELLSHRLQETTENLHSHKTEFLRIEDDWQRKHNHLLGKIREEQAQKEETTASLEAETQKHSELNNENVQLKEDNRNLVLLKEELQQKEKQYKQQLCKKDEELWNLKVEKGHLCHKLQEGTKNLQSHRAELLQSEEDWQQKNNNLQKKAKMPASPEAATQNVSEQNDDDVQLSEENPDNVLLKNFIWMKLKWYNKKLLEKDEELLKLREDNEVLSLSLQETSEYLRSYKLEFLQSEDDWQKKYTDLQMTLSEEQADDEDGSSPELEKDVVQKDLQMKVNWCNLQLCEKDEELLSLREDNERLSHSLQMMTEHLPSHKTESHLREDEGPMKDNHLLEETKELTEKENIQGTRVGELEEEKGNKEEEKTVQEDQDLHQRLADQMKITDKLLKSNKAWQEIYDALQEKFKEELLLKDHSWETTIKHLEEELVALREELQQKVQEEEELSTKLWESKKELKRKQKEETKKRKQKEKELKAARKKRARKSSRRRQLLELAAMAEKSDCDAEVETTAQ